jgi:hypothetical protein
MYEIIRQQPTHQTNVNEFEENDSKVHRSVRNVVLSLSYHAAFNNDMLLVLIIFNITLYSYPPSNLLDRHRTNESNG